MAKIVLNNITAGYASVDLLNQNFDAIEAAFENTLSRDGTSPNTLTADLDLNHNDILNVGDLQVVSLEVDGTDYQVAAQDMIDQMTVIYNNMLALNNVTVSTASPTGGNNGDIWFKVST